MEPPPCQWAGRCGGCDLLHVAPTAQESWKARVIADQLARIGGIHSVGADCRAVVVESVPVDAQPPGLGWHQADAGCRYQGQAAAAFTSAVVSCWRWVPVRWWCRRCRRPSFGMAGGGADGGCRWRCTRRRAGGRRRRRRHRGGVSRADPHRRPAGDVPVPPGWRRAATVRRGGLGRSWRVATDGFWQAHVRAPEVLGAAVLQSGDAVTGMRPWWSCIAASASSRGARRRRRPSRSGRPAVEATPRASARIVGICRPAAGASARADVRGWVGPPAGVRLCRTPTRWCWTRPIRRRTRHRGGAGRQRPSFVTSPVIRPARPRPVTFLAGGGG